MATDAAQIKSEIARLTASISQHKSKTATANPTTARYPSYPPPSTSTSWPPRSSTYINPNYKPQPNKYIRPTSTTAPPSVPAAAASARPPLSTSSSGGVKEVVLNGVAFESSTRSLVRKDLPKPKPTAPKSKPASNSATSAPPRPHTRPFPPQRVYKPKSTRGRGCPGRARGGNMTLTNSRRPYNQGARPKRQKSDKPCPRFSTTGTCTRGLTCPYTHDPATTAICWPFLSGTCPLPAAQCALSHDPTPERTPLCTHFLNGSCTRPSCPFPHVNVGPRSNTNICRDFAVLGYCKLGLACDKAHVRECPDFAESGKCEQKRCRLPHVIRAAGARKLPPDAKTKTAAATTGSTTKDKDGKTSKENEKDVKSKPAEDAEMGDEFISLTFNESSEEDEEEESEDSDSESDASEADDGEDASSAEEEEGGDDDEQMKADDAGGGGGD
ncbi:hypothetical protein B0H13DRAFT_2069845 [Mycena leptocephala]|nr:hypothetical protein B0H13DRAFT_2069845 [Mycena leptocephala]